MDILAQLSTFSNQLAGPFSCFDLTMASTNVLPSSDVVNAWGTVSNAVKHFRVNPELWRGLAIELGDEEIGDLEMLASIADVDFETVKDKIFTKALQKAAVNRLYARLKARFGLATGVLQGPICTTPAAAAAAGPLNTSTTNKQLALAVGVPALIARVKLSEVINQGIEQEIPLLDDNTLGRMRQKYIDICGDEPLANHDPSDSQLTALHFLVENAMPPYTILQCGGRTGYEWRGSSSLSNTLWTQAANGGRPSSKAQPLWKCGEHVGRFSRWLQYALG